MAWCLAWWVEGDEVCSVMWCAMMSGVVNGGMVFRGVMGVSSVAWCLLCWLVVWYG